MISGGRLTRDPEQTVVLNKHLAGARFNSVHPAGVQFLLGDGSVRCLGLWIDQQVYRRLLNRRDGGAGDEW